MNLPIPDESQTPNDKQTRRSSHGYRAASEKMGHQFFSTTIFMVNALDWLGEKFGDVHLEYHKDAGGWQDNMPNGAKTAFQDSHWR
jgi:hypothetical protein